MTTIHEQRLIEVTIDQILSARANQLSETNFKNLKSVLDRAAKVDENGNVYILQPGENGDLTVKQALDHYADRYVYAVTEQARKLAEENTPAPSPDQVPTEYEQGGGIAARAIAAKRAEAFSPSQAGIAAYRAANPTQGVDDVYLSSGERAARDANAMRQYHANKDAARQAKLDKHRNFFRHG